MNRRKREALFNTLVRGHVTEPGGYSYMENTGAVYIKESKGRDTFVGNVDRDFPMPKDVKNLTAKTSIQARFPVTKQDVVGKDPTANSPITPGGPSFTPKGH